MSSTACSVADGTCDPTHLLLPALILYGAILGSLSISAVTAACVFGLRNHLVVDSPLPSWMWTDD